MQGSGLLRAQMNQTPPRRASKSEILEAFLANLRQRGNIDLEAPGVVDGIRQHFNELPTRYALDVNISTLDVLNHKRWAAAVGFLCMPHRCLGDLDAP